MVTRNYIDVCHGAHIFPYALGNYTAKIYHRLGDVLGRERKENPQRLIYGDPNTVIPTSKALINSLYKMVTLSADTHSS